MRLLLLIVLISLTGCGVLSHRSEYFQDKVQKMPALNVEHKETQKQAADYIAKKTKETVSAAILEDSSTNVLKPALEAEVVADSLSGSMGKPLEPWGKSANVLAVKLDKLDAKLDRAVEQFREYNDENQGKAIEGTGLFSISYGTKIMIFGLFLVGAYIAVKVLSLFNPAVSVGSQVLSGGFRGITKIATKGFSQIISAGEQFKKSVDDEFADPKTKEKIFTLFRQAQLEKQDSEVQEVIKKLTNPDVK